MRKSHMKLIICGNGLDLHVGFKTRYQDYRQYLLSEGFLKERETVDIIDNSDFLIPTNVDRWSDLENSLSFDCDKYLQKYIVCF